MDLLLFEHWDDMVWQTTVICLFMSSSFSEINSSFPKPENTTPHKRMKQHLEGRMLRDRCKAFISDHLLQELPQDANDDLQNQQGESTVSGVLGMFLASTQTFSGVVWVPRVSFLSIWLQVSTLHMKSILCFEACHPCQNHSIVSRFSQINSWTTCKFWKMNLL